MVSKFYKIRWTDDDDATPKLIDPLLEDTGIDSNEEVRKATKEYLLETMDDCNLTMGILETIAHSFADGYRKAINK